VPKNANMMMRKICEATGMSRVKLKDQASTETVCILRNPRTRLISALGEFRKRKRRSESLEQLLENLLNDPTGFDEHLEPQLHYIEGIAFTHILKFEKLDQELQRSIWFKQHQPVVESHLNPDRLANSKHHQTSIESLLKQHHGVVENIIDRYYTRDVELWQNHLNYQNQKL
jgi:hypothetical protein